MLENESKCILRKRGWKSSVFVALLFISLIKILSSIIYLKYFSINDQISVIIFYLYSNVFSFILIFLINKFFNKESLNHLKLGSNLILNFFKGLIFMFFLILILFIALLIFTEVKINISKTINIKLVVILIIGFIIQGITEEIIFRAYIQNNIMQYKSKKTTIIIQALIFSFVHILNLGISFIAIINLFLMGIFFGLIYDIYKNIWFVGILHASWNFILGIVLGFKISGVELPEKILNTRIISNSLFSGGRFGIESSIFTTIIFILLISYFSKKLLI